MVASASLKLPPLRVGRAILSHAAHEDRSALARESGVNLWWPGTESNGPAQGADKSAVRSDLNRCGMFTLRGLIKWWPGTESNCRHGDFQSS